MWVEDVCTMTGRVHPEFDHRSGKGEVSMGRNHFTAFCESVGELPGGIWRVYLSSCLIVKALSRADVFSKKWRIDSRQLKAVPHGTFDPDLAGMRVKSILDHVFCVSLGRLSQ